METVAEIAQPANTNNTIDGIPIPAAIGGLSAIIPLAAWLAAFAIREFIKVKVEEAKAKSQSELEQEKAEREQERAIAQERAELIEELREQNRMFVKEILNLNQVMENSGPLIDSPSKINRR